MVNPFLKFGFVNDSGAVFLSPGYKESAEGPTRHNRSDYPRQLVHGTADQRASPISHPRLGRSRSEILRESHRVSHWR